MHSLAIRESLGYHRVGHSDLPQTPPLPLLCCFTALDLPPHQLLPCAHHVSPLYLSLAVLPPCTSPLPPLPHPHHLCARTPPSPPVPPPPPLLPPPCTPSDHPRIPPHPLPCSLTTSDPILCLLSLTHTLWTPQTTLGPLSWPCAPTCHCLCPLGTSPSHLSLSLTTACPRTTLRPPSDHPQTTHPPSSMPLGPPSWPCVPSRRPSNPLLPLPHHCEPLDPSLPCPHPQCPPLDPVHQPATLGTFPSHLSLSLTTACLRNPLPCPQHPFLPSAPTCCPLHHLGASPSCHSLSFTTVCPWTTLSPFSWPYCERWGTPLPSGPPALSSYCHLAIAVLTPQGEDDATSP